MPVGTLHGRGRLCRRGHLDLFHEVVAEDQPVLIVASRLPAATLRHLDQADAQ
jgi:hypothetical protein